MLLFTPCACKNPETITNRGSKKILLHEAETSRLDCDETNLYWNPAANQLKASHLTGVILALSSIRTTRLWRVEYFHDNLDRDSRVPCLYELLHEMTYQIVSRTQVDTFSYLMR